MFLCLLTTKRKVFQLQAKSLGLLGWVGGLLCGTAKLTLQAKKIDNLKAPVGTGSSFAVSIEKTDTNQII